jgi:(R,R)-butanediol dehydrogenase/meso-butanediol dehydrogenase/diacetyl reductase
VSNELMLRGNNAYRFEDLEEAVRIINCSEHDFSWLISRIMPVEQAPEAFALLTAKDKKDLKILIDL